MVDKPHWGADNLQFEGIAGGEYANPAFHHKLSVDYAYVGLSKRPIVPMHLVDSKYSYCN
jgi:hypothetical protein